MTLAGTPLMDRPLAARLDGRRVGIVTGGRSAERDRSLLSGEAVRDSLARQGVAHVVLDAADRGFAEAVGHVDLAVLAIAGQWAEDGKLQGLLETLGVPYTGSGVLASAMAMHKPTAKMLAHAAGVAVLPHAVVEGRRDPTDEARSILERLGHPVILKPTSEGGSIGMRVLRDVDSLAAAVTAEDTTGGRWFVEPFLDGTAVTCAVIETDRGLMAFPPLETAAVGSDFYDYTAKRDPARRRYRCPATIPGADQVPGLALAAHEALGCSGYSRVDFLVTPDGEAVLLEVNTLPGLSHTGNLAVMAEAAGLTYDQLIAALVATARPTGYRP